MPWDRDYPRGRDPRVHPAIRSGTGAFFLAAIGVATPGSCVSDDGGNLEKLFGASGFVCSNATAKTDLKDYGFPVTPLCGVTG